MAVVNGTNASETINQLDGVTNSSDKISGLGGNDTIYGLGGNDSIHGGTGNDIVYAGSGNDSIYGDAGTDFLYGEAGNDRFFMNDAESLDNVEGGSGIDWLDLGAMTFEGIEPSDDITPLLRVDLKASQITFYTHEVDIFDVENIHGTNWSDYLFGNDLDNTILGNDGADHIFGGGGNDTLSGGALFDDLWGEAGADHIEGGDAPDYLQGGEGNDVLSGDGDDDYLTGGEGADVLSGGAGFDYAFYDDKAGVVVSLANAAINTGSAAGDTFDSIEALSGTGYADKLYGDAGANALDGYAGDDRLDGGAGNDIFYGGGGADTFVGGAGTDSVTYGGGPIIVSLTNPSINTDEAAGDTYSSIEDLVSASGGADQLYGNAVDNTLVGAGGDDRLVGYAGNDKLYGDTDHNGGPTSIDKLYGGQGDDHLQGRFEGDYLSGGTGSDTATYVDAFTAVVASLADPSINTGEAAGDSYSLVENLEGSAFRDSLSGDAGANILSGLAGDDGLAGAEGNDTLRGGQGGDVLSGDAGIDTASYSNAASKVTASLANAALNKGEAAGDSYSSVENIAGSAFDDIVYGDNAVNTVSGGAGNDTIKGYRGNDTLAGGSGNDVFIFNSALNATTNVDTITDFADGDDTVQLDNSYFAALTTTGTLAASAFRANTTGLAGDSNDRILYETDTGNLYYDADGTGAGARILFATLTGTPAIGNADFAVI